MLRYNNKWKPIGPANLLSRLARGENAQILLALQRDTIPKPIFKRAVLSLFHLRFQVIVELCPLLDPGDQF